MSPARALVMRHAEGLSTRCVELRIAMGRAPVKRRPALAAELAETERARAAMKAALTEDEGDDQ